MFPKPSKANSESSSKPVSVKPAPKPPSVSPPAPSSPPFFSLPLSGYARVGSTYYYFSGRYVYRDDNGSCVVSSDYSLICSRSLEVWRVLPPSASAVAVADGEPAHPQGGGGLVNIQNKSHTPTPSSVSFSSGGANP